LEDVENSIPPITRLMSLNTNLCTFIFSGYQKKAF